MARIVIGIHGLGNKPGPSILTEWWEKSMIEGLELNGYSAKLPKFEMVYWADILHSKLMDINISDPENPLYLDEKYVPSPTDFIPKKHPVRKKILKFLGEQLYKIFLNKDLSLNYSFIPNYFVRRYFKEIEIYYKEDSTQKDPQACKINVLIKQRLIVALEKHKDDEIMLVCHSMGSIIAYDVLSFVLPNVRIRTFVTIGSPLGMPIIVSKIASQYKLRSRGRRRMVTPPGVYGNWFNYSDVLDKITFNYKLGKKFGANALGVKPKDYEVINDYHNSEGEHNPHKSYGYLRSKEFARVLNDFVENSNTV
jgi:hypothetical protein